MKLSTIFIIILAMLIVTFIVSGVIILKKNGQSKIGNWIFSYISYHIPQVICLFVLVNTLGYKSYSLTDIEEFNDDHKLPQVDSMMHLIIHSRSQTYFVSKSKKSIQHYSKTIEYDLIDIYSSEDVFVNIKENKKLDLLYIKPNVYRDKILRIQLTDLGKENEKGHIRILNPNQFDSVLTSWNLKDDIYKKFKFY